MRKTVSSSTGRRSWCEHTGMPGLILSPYTHLWIREADRIVIEKDQSPLTRVIHLDGSAPPADYEPSILGYSVGRFEDDGTLIVETTGFCVVHAF